MELASNLNDSQRLAVTTGDGPSLVLAGAGSGKTRVIVERLVWLISERGIDPRSILAVTFTNRAAERMRTCVAARLGIERIAAWVGTFHAFGLWMLRRDIEKLGRPKSFTIFDDSDQLSLIKRLIKELPAPFVRVSPREALEWISRYKQSLKEPGPAQPGEDPEERSYRELWGRYHAALGKVSGVDFDDLLLLPARLLDVDDDVRRKYQQRFQHILVDEYQDTNHAQYYIAKRLSEGHGNLFVVGDEDQSIYSWRGADLHNILDFERDFPGAKVFRLEQNYRSTGPILAAANAVVKNNVERLGKTLYTVEPGGDPVRFYLAEDAEDEARFVAEDIVRSGVAPKDVAVLFRVGAQSRVMEEALRRKGLAYVVVGGVKFYARKEIKDILSYLRLLVNPDDDVSLQRILNVPSRGIGATNMQHLEEYATSRGASLFRALRDIETSTAFTAGIKTSARGFVQLIDDLTLDARKSAVGPLVGSLLDRTGYREYVKQSDEKDFRSRLEVVDEFLSACSEFDKKTGTGLAAFLQELALETDVDSWEPGAPTVTLMTCHGAKGLEFEHVFLIGLEEGLLPHGSALESDRELEEERRLCYVAMTRARKRLTLTAAESRSLHGTTHKSAPSRFLGEIPSGQLAAVSHGGKPDKMAQGARPTATAATGLKTGTRVRHGRFGSGTVMYTSGSGPRLRAGIRFDTGFSREFMVGLAPLEILESRKR